MHSTNQIHASKHPWTANYCVCMQLYTRLLGRKSGILRLQMASSTLVLLHSGFLQQRLGNLLWWT